MLFMCFDKHCHVQLRIFWEGEFVAKCLKCHVDWSIKNLKAYGHSTHAHARTHTLALAHTHNARARDRACARDRARARACACTQARRSGS